LTILRYQNVYGPEQSALSSHTGILTYFIRNAMEQKPIRLFEDGAIVRDFTYISDVARANALAAASSTNDFKVINIGTGVPLTLLDAAKAIVAACNSRSSIEITGQFRVGDVRSACADVNRMQTELMMPPPTPLRDGIAVMRDSYRRGGSVVAPVIL
jgi:dTDP-L-rhamnose 4-epimerase